MKAQFRINDKIEIVNIVVKDRLRKEQTCNINFVVTRALFSTPSGQVYIDTNRWTVRDYKTGVAICNGKTKKNTISKFRKMVGHEKFILFYNELTKNKEIINHPAP